MQNTSTEGMVVIDVAELPFVPPPAPASISSAVSPASPDVGPPCRANGGALRLVLPHSAVDTWVGVRGAADWPRFQHTAGETRARELCARPDQAAATTLADASVLGVTWERVIFDDALAMLARASPGARALLSHVAAPRRWLLTPSPPLGAQLGREGRGCVDRVPQRRCGGVRWTL